MRVTRLLRMGGHGHAVERSAEYGGFAAPHISTPHKRVGTFMGAVMWFWIFYRAREDGPALLGLRHPWDHHGHGHDDHHGHHEEEHGHGHHEEAAGHAPAKPAQMH